MSSGRFNLNDSGAPVAEALGMTCIERPRLSPEETSADMDAEFLAAFAPGDRYFAAFEGALAGRVLLTGHHGDAQWNISARDDAPYFRVGGGSGRGLREFRSRNDFFVMPVPMIGATRIEDVVRISNSAEMAPFGHGKAYDRPIPRRIGREGGIPDAAFGQRKAVASVAFWEGGFGPETVRRSDAFARRVVGPMARAKEAGARGVVRVLTWLLAAPADSPSRIQRLRYAIGRRAAGRISNRLNFRPHRAVMTLWAIETLATRYRDAMPAEEEVRDAA